MRTAKVISEVKCKGNEINLGLCDYDVALICGTGRFGVECNGELCISVFVFFSHLIVQHFYLVGLLLCSWVF